MLSAITLHQVSGDDTRLREALHDANLPTDDIEDQGRAFFEAISGTNEIVGYAGLERCDSDYLLRSVVVLPACRGHGVGQAIVEAALQGVGDGDVFLATTSAAPFFSSIGFSEVPRAEVPAAVLATRQLSSICPSSATIMKLNRPPT
ncbi:arsenic resistance N-acetyltransferase ArsN2 [uncultured Agrobacterium sp.]|uniref:arsenic resistance N-acetyltransferase ArsN2 n=1 Tax=uncultured Agrobacterium sp. TaxID=157277 RepID=UPI0025D3BDF1|nr:arsenic resistance N-acetyltransferase ArsN2 [uncultured Agrobacterium sp.]